jgi:hypothetical protein
MSLPAVAPGQDLQAPETLQETITRIALAAMENLEIRRQAGEAAAMVALFGGDEIARSIWWRQGVDKLAPLINLGELSGRLDHDERESCRESVAAALIAAAAGVGAQDSLIKERFERVTPFAWDLATGAVPGVAGTEQSLGF